MLLNIFWVILNYLLDCMIRIYSSKNQLQFKAKFDKNTKNSQYYKWLSIFGERG